MSENRIREAADDALKMKSSDVGAGREDRRYFTENPSALAFLGDAVYEVRIRRHVYRQGAVRPDRMNAEAIRYVRAEAQAKAYDRLLPEMQKDEAAVSRRAKNHRITSMPGNVEPGIYKKATAFEALLGYLDLCGRTERIGEIVRRAIEIIDAEPVEIRRRR